MERATDVYRRQTWITDPGDHAPLYVALPEEPIELARVVQGLLITPYGRGLRRYGLTPEDIDDAGFGVRLVAELIARILSRSPDELVIARAPFDRVGAICRNFAVLHVSMLRSKGIAARPRVGFAGYLSPNPTWWCDHRITEYFDASTGRWRLLDPWVDAVLARGAPVTADVTDLGPTRLFLLAGEAWQACRRGSRDPDTFGDSETDRGMAPIRYALMQDFCYLNGFEVLGNDDWGALTAAPEETLDALDLVFLDQVADLTVNVDRSLSDLRSTFESSSYGQEVIARARSTI